MRLLVGFLCLAGLLLLCGCGMRQHIEVHPLIIAPWLPPECVRIDVHVNQGKTVDVVPEVRASVDGNTVRDNTVPVNGGLPE